ncbi:MAG: beta-lactamase family protein, partial [Sphingopyxis sp.]|nr:beta-lactamase family protein [Sphingopyxis sp.]
RTPGIVTLVARHGEVEHLSAVGRRDLACDAPMATDAIFRIASMTKPITGAAMMILREEGLWDLDDPVVRHVPAFGHLTVLEGDGRRVPVGRPMTMRDLMRQTSGLAYVVLDHPVDRLYRDRDVLDPESDLAAMIGKLADLPLAFQPGERWYYSIGVDVQGYIIEQLSGQSLDAFFRDRIFGPLGMADTGFHVPSDKADRLAALYIYDERGVLTPKADRLAPTTPPGLLSGGSGLFSTAMDYFRFCQMMLDDGMWQGSRLLRRESIEAMRSDQMPPGVAYGLFGPEPGESFGLDVAITVDPAAAHTPKGAGSYWWGGGYGTWFSIDPANGIILIGMNQLTDKAAYTSAELRTQSEALAYAALVNP